jgi:hypothetical protein
MRGEHTPHAYLIPIHIPPDMCGVIPRILQIIPTFYELYRLAILQIPYRILHIIPTRIVYFLAIIPTRILFYTSSPYYSILPRHYTDSNITYSHRSPFYKLYRHPPRHVRGHPAHASSHARNCQPVPRTNQIVQP